jgi:hypothetical protein
LGSQRSLPVAKGNGLFQAHFSATIGDLNNTKSVGFTLEGNPTREIYGFLKSTVPIKRLDFLAEAQENGLVNHQTAFRPCTRVSVQFAVKSVLGSFSHGVSFSSKQSRPKLRPSKSFGYSCRCGFIIVYGSIALAAGIDGKRIIIPGPRCRNRSMNRIGPS